MRIYDLGTRSSLVGEDKIPGAFLPKAPVPLRPRGHFRARDPTSASALCISLYISRGMIRFQQRGQTRTILNSSKSTFTTNMRKRFTIKYSTSDLWKKKLKLKPYENLHSLFTYFSAHHLPGITQKTMHFSYKPPERSEGYRLVLGYIVVVYCISLRRGASFNDISLSLSLTHTVVPTPVGYRSCLTIE
jgi:hypothetical protein